MNLGYFWLIWKLKSSLIINLDIYAGCPSVCLHTALRMNLLYDIELDRDFSNVWTCIQSWAQNLIGSFIIANVNHLLLIDLGIWFDHLEILFAENFTSWSVIEKIRLEKSDLNFDLRIFIRMKSDINYDFKIFMSMKWDFNFQIEFENEI